MWSRGWAGTSLRSWRGWTRPRYERTLRWRTFPYCLSASPRCSTSRSRSTNGRCRCPPSIGVSTPAAPGAETEQLLQQADAALYKAKNSQRGSVAFFDSALGHEVDRRALLDQALRLALTREEFAEFYQPIVDLGTGRLQSAEALLRWEAAGLGPDQPGGVHPDR